MEEFIKRRVTAVIHAKGSSERKVSLALGRSDSYVNKALNNRMRFTIELLDGICKELDITPEEFFAVPDVANTSQYLLLKEMEDLTAEDIEQLRSMIQYMKKKNAQIKKKR